MAFSVSKKRSGPVARLLRHGDVPWSVILVVMSGIVLVLVILIGLSIWQQSALSRELFGTSFVTPQADTSWDPINDQFDAWPIIIGTLVTSLIAILLATPISVFIAIFLAELCPERLRTPINFMVEMLAAIPSIVFGMWGIFVFLPTVVKPVGDFLSKTLGFLPLFSGTMPASGISRLAASMILTIMIIPTITAVSRDVLRAIPRAQREASLALGATRWEMIWQVLLPYGLSGILGAVILGLGRALGETMAVTLVIGNNTVEQSGSLLLPGATLASVIANEFAEAVTKVHTSALIELGVILFIMTLLLNIVARFLVWRVARRVPEARA
ncbi:MAG TPA: phosphate ABC transporter permease subunit PstC [Anaerolineae bacterium]|nr:phosphate ABC transporter permease subunit PstC [Anaerolineae bacterium]